MKIGKTYSFEAAHHLPNHQGKCQNWHGHSYKVEVEVEGEPGPYSDRPDYGMVLDFDVLDAAMQPILITLDHRDLNTIPEIRYPTAENIADYIAGWLVRNLGNVVQPEVTRVRLWETAKAYAEWTA